MKCALLSVARRGDFIHDILDTCKCRYCTRYVVYFIIIYPESYINLKGAVSVVNIPARLLFSGRSFFMASYSCMKWMWWFYLTRLVWWQERNSACTHSCPWGSWLEIFEEEIQHGNQLTLAHVENTCWDQVMVLMVMVEPVEIRLWCWWWWWCRWWWWNLLGSGHGMDGDGGTCLDQVMVLMVMVEPVEMRS